MVGIFVCELLVLSVRKVAFCPVLYFSIDCDSDMLIMDTGTVPLLGLRKVRN